MFENGHRGTAVERRRSTVNALPLDAQERIALLDALTANRRAPSRDAFQIDLDGELVAVEILIEADDNALHDELLSIVGDVRCLERDGRPMLEARFFRDGRRDRGHHLVRPDDVWPSDSAPLAVDFHDALEVTVARFEALLASANAAREDGRTVYFVNLPRHLRMHAEVCLGTSLLPIKRERVGPLLPEVLSDPGR